MMDMKNIEMMDEELDSVVGGAGFIYYRKNNSGRYDMVASPVAMNEKDVLALMDHAVPYNNVFPHKGLKSVAILNKYMNMRERELNASSNDKCIRIDLTGK